MLIINSITSASSNVTYNFLGTDRNFGSTLSATYTCVVAEATLQQDDVLWLGIDALDRAYMKQIVVARIGVDEFTNGKIKSISYSPSPLTGDLEATINIEQYQKAQSYDSTIFNSIPSPQLVSSFTSTYNFARNGNSYTFSRNASIQYIDDPVGDFMHKAYLFLKNFYLYERPNYGYHSDGISELVRFDDGFRPFISEEIDLINLSVSLSESFQCNTINGEHSELITITDAVTEEGFREKSYNVQIAALKEPLELLANRIAKTRIQEIIDENATNYGSPISIEKTVPKDGRTVSFNLKFSTDTRKSQTDAVTYVISKQKVGRFFEYNVQIEYNSNGANFAQKKLNVRNAWVANKNRPAPKVQYVYYFNTDIYEKSRNVTFQYLESKIQENIVFTDDPSYNSSSFEDGILKSFQTITINNKIYRISRFVDIYSTIELYHKSALQTIGAGTINLEVTQRGAENYLFGKETLDARTINFPSANYAITSDVVSIDLAQGVTRRSISYQYY
jgi:hypothetical protein